MDAPLQLDEARLTRLGMDLSAKFFTFESDRKPLEEQWLKNLRQFRGIYDPEIEKKIRPDGSKAYPKLTRQKVIGTVARLMEMLFPRTEKNWNIEPSPMPNLSEEDMQAILDNLQAENPGQEVTDAVIEKMIMEVAKAKAERMGKTIDDQLAEIEFVTLARRVIFSGVLYGIGLLEGPLIRREKRRRWQRNGLTGRFEAVETSALVPYAEHRRVWEWYPDLSAKTLYPDKQEGYFIRHILTRQGLAELATRKDFLGDKIRGWLAQHDGGNYQERYWENEARSRKSDRQDIQNLNGRKYEVISWVGEVSGHDLRAAGVNISDDKLADMHEAVVWILDKEVIKARLNPLEKKHRMMHYFIYEEDDINLTGQGLPQILRDSQMGACESIRMTFDNGSVVCGPVTEVDATRLMPGQTADLHAFKAFLVDPYENDSDRPVVRAVEINSHIDELLAIFNICREIMDAEAALPPQSLGDVSQGGSEAMRTSGNLSMIFGAAALPIRDAVRNFDTFTTSFIGSMYDWNMEFNEDATIKGDYQIIARGSTSLIAKEVRAQGLEYMASTLQPEDRIYLKGKKFLMERLKVRDIDFDDLLEDDDIVAQKQEEMAALAQEDREDQRRLISAQIQDIMGGFVKNLALARKADVGADTDVYSVIMEAMKGAADIDAKDRATQARSKPAPSKTNG